MESYWDRCNFELSLTSIYEYYFIGALVFNYRTPCMYFLITG